MKNGMDFPVEPGASGEESGQQQLIIRLIGAGGLAEELQQLLYGEVFLLFPGYVYRHVAVDVSGEEKRHLTVEQLLELFSKASGSDEADDKLLLS